MHPWIAAVMAALLISAIFILVNLYSTKKMLEDLRKWFQSR